MFVMMSVGKQSGSVNTCSGPLYIKGAWGATVFNLQQRDPGTEVVIASRQKGEKDLEFS